MEQAETGAWGKSFCQSGNKYKTGTTYRGLLLTTARSLESFSKSHFSFQEPSQWDSPIKTVGGNPARFFQMKT